MVHQSVKTLSFIRDSRWVFSYIFCIFRWQRVSNSQKYWVGNCSISPPLCHDATECMHYPILTARCFLSWCPSSSQSIASRSSWRSSIIVRRKPDWSPTFLYGPWCTWWHRPELASVWQNPVRHESSSSRRVSVPFTPYRSNTATWNKLLSQKAVVCLHAALRLRM